MHTPGERDHKRMERNISTKKVTKEKRSEISKKANSYFFAKVIVNALLIIIGAVAIALFLHQMQNRTALAKQQANSEQALVEAVAALSSNEADAQELTTMFHEGNQDMLDDLYQLLIRGSFSDLSDADSKTRAEVFADLVKRSGVEYFFIMGLDRTMLVSPNEALEGVDLVKYGLLTADNATRLISGTRSTYGEITPAAERNSSGYYYFYSTRLDYKGQMVILVLGTDASVLDVQIGSLKDPASVLKRAAVGNGGFLFSVNTDSERFVYFNNGTEDLSGRSATEAGLSRAAFTDGYTGTETINGVRYFCVSKAYGDETVICAVADTEQIFINDKYVLFWSVTGFVLVMILCLVYAIIVRNDFVRHAVDTKKKILRKKSKNPIIFDVSIFTKVFPLMLLGVLLVFFISFYSQTLLEITEAIDRSVIALDEVTGRYEESLETRDVITEYYDSRYLSKAKVIAYILEEDPSVLNEPSDKYYTTYDESGRKYYLTDDEGNRLRSVAYSAGLQELCRSNDLKSIFIFNTDGNTIATNTDTWYFKLSFKEGDQSYPFRDVLDGRKESFVQEPMVNELGEAAQYIGVSFNYYTTSVDGETKFVSRRAHLADPEGSTMHRAMLQIGLEEEISKKLLASTDVSYILSSDALGGGFIVLFDNTEEHRCVYSPREASIGVTAADLGVSAKAFTGADYYGFMRINGTVYFQYFRYNDGYFIATALPKSQMYTSRMIISSITALVSLLLILFLSGTVTLTSKEEEVLYATMSDDEAKRGLDSAIFNIILPSGKRASTVKAAARWDNKSIPWNEKSPEQKLLVLFSVLGGILMFYVIIAILGVDLFFNSDSIVKYILSGDWDRGPNVFAYSACFMVLVFTAVIVSLFKIPVRVLSSLVGARGETIGHLLISVVKYGGALGALFYCLYLLGIDSSSLLASAGLLSLVIGLGAQSLIKDILAGIFIVFEGEFRVGDIVTISGYRGTVMDIGLRTTKVMGVDGNIKIYNNSEISGVLNMTKEASVAISNISVEYGQDIDYVEAVLKRDLPALKEKNPQILDGPVYRGVSTLGESGVELIITCTCNEADIKDVVRYMNKEILQIFYRNGINVPFPNITLSNLDPNGRKTIKDFLAESADVQEAKAETSDAKKAPAAGSMPEAEANDPAGGADVE